MPTLTRWYIKTALGWLVVALGAGVGLQAGIASIELRARLWPVYLHVITIGWLTGLVFGVAWWLFPRPGKDMSDRTPLGWTSYLLLNAGLLGRVVAEPLVGTARPGDWEAVVLALAALAQLGGVTMFAMVIWPRVRSR